MKKLDMPSYEDAFEVFNKPPSKPVKPLKALLKALLNPSPEQTAAERSLRETLASSGISIDL